MMHYVKLRAIRPLKGEYGSADPGDIFETTNRDADILEAKGLAERYVAPPLPSPEDIQRQIAEYRSKAISGAPENKAITPNENKEVTDDENAAPALNRPIDGPISPRPERNVLGGGRDRAQRNG